MAVYRDIVLSSLGAAGADVDVGGVDLGRDVLAGLVRVQHDALVVRLLARERRRGAVDTVGDLEQLVEVACRRGHHGVVEASAALPGLVAAVDAGLAGVLYAVVARGDDAAVRGAGSAAEATKPALADKDFGVHHGCRRRCQQAVGRLPAAIRPIGRRVPQDGGACGSRTRNFRRSRNSSRAFAVHRHAGGARARAFCREGADVAGRAGLPVRGRGRHGTAVAAGGGLAGCARGSAEGARITQYAFRPGSRCTGVPAAGAVGARRDARRRRDRAGDAILAGFAGHAGLARVAVGAGRAANAVLARRAAFAIGLAADRDARL